MKNFWQKLPKPFFALAPMDDVTDTVFRQIVLGIGKPDVFFTEFTNTDGMCSNGRSRVEHKLRFTKEELPLIAQIWGTNPKHFSQTTKIIREMGFTGVDINMGCPEKSIVKKGSCSALINNQKLAAEIIKAVKIESGEMPVSVKTRLGFNEIKTEEWISFLLEQDLDAITIHARTAKEESKVPAHWEEITKAVAIKNRLNKQTIIIGNGDITSKNEGREKAMHTKVDGIMIGRGIFQNPWLFSETTQVTAENRVKMLLKHAKLFDKTWGKQKRFVIMRKFVKTYVHSFEEAGELRAKLMETKNLAQMEEVLSNHLVSASKSRNISAV